MSSIDALLRPVSQEDELRALADSLRKKKRAADFFAISTIQPLANLGQSEGNAVMDATKQQGLLREALAQRLSDEQLAIANAEADAEEGRKDRENRLLVASLRKINGPSNGASYSEPKTQKEREAFEQGGVRASTLNDLTERFKDEYANSAKDGDIPLTGDITNFLGRKMEGWVPEKWTEKAGFWSDYKEQADLVRRHELFGSALTRNEQAQYERAMITATDGPATIRRKLETQRRLANKVAELDAARSLQKGYDPKQVMMNYGDVVDIENLAAKVADGSYFEELAARQAADRGNKKETATEADSYENMTEAEIDAELERRKRGG